jgi:serine/threonine protein kinase/tetratricopeptide (TPR) repeat protein
MPYAPRERLRSSPAALIYRGTDEATNLDCIMKLFKDPFASTDVFTDKVDSVATKLKYLNHENIVSIKEIGTHSDRLYIATEILDINLTEYIKRHETLDLVPALTMLMKIIDGLIYGYENELEPHLDLRSNNILMSSEDEIPKIADWYMAQGMLMLEQQKRAEWEDARYMAPEQIHGIGDTGVHTDIYQIGILLYQMLVGYPIFQGEDEDVRYHQVYVSPRKHVEYYAQIPSMVQEIILNCLEKDPSKRYPNLEELNDAVGYTLSAASYRKKAPADSLVGTILDSKWEVIEDLGHGHFASTFKVLEMGRENTYTLKLFDKQISQKEEFVRAMNNDMFARTQIRHPQVVNLIASGWHDDKYYLVFDYVPTSLANILADEPQLTPEQALRIIRRTTAILEYLHRKGTLKAHQQLKPEHILINPQGEDIFLTDFRLEETSRFIQDEFGLPLSSYHYSAPEIITDEGEIGPSADIYALATLLYKLVTGMDLFKGKIPQDVMDKHLNWDPKEEIVNNQNIPMVFHDIIIKALEKNPEDRYPDYTAFLADIVQLTGDSETAGGLKLIETGTKIKGKYVLEERIPLYGGQPLLYRGFHTQTETPVMIWFYRFTRTKEMEDIFNKAVKDISKYNHPNILRVLEHGHDKGAFFFVTELRELTLREFVANTDFLDEETAIELIKQTTEALKHVNDEGRDYYGSLNPDNIFVLESPVLTVKIAGYERVFLYTSPHDQNNSSYLPPEHITGLGKKGAPSDIYSLAMVLYFILTGRDLITGEPHEIINKHVFAEPQELLKDEDIHPNLKRILARCIDKDMMSRYPDLQELIDDLDDYLASRSGGDETEAPLSFLLGSSSFRSEVEGEKDVRHVFANRLPATSSGIRGVITIVSGIGNPEQSALAQNRAIAEIEKIFSPSRLLDLPLDEDPLALIHEAINRANGAINQEAFRLNQLGKFGAEIILGLITRNRLYLGRVGAAFAYLFRGHSIRTFLRKPEDKRMLGREMTIKIDTTERHLRLGDILVLGTGNLSRVLADLEIRNTVLSTQDVQESCERIIGLAANRFKGKREEIAGASTVIVQFGEILAQMPKAHRFHAAPVIHHYLQKGIAYYENGLYDQAINEFNKAYDISPDAFSVNYQLALAYLGKGAVDMANSFILKALALFPNFVDGHIKLGDIYYAKGKIDDAEEEYFYACQLGMENPEPWTALGQFYFKQNLYGQAMNHFARALELSPNHKHAQQGMELAKKRAKTLGGVIKESTSSMKSGIKRPFKRK